MKTLLKIIALGLLLSGCAHKAVKAPLISEDWPQHKAQVEAQNHWQALGKLAVKVPNDGGSANLQWQQTGNQYEIDLKGPFGSGKLNISGKPGNVTLTEAGQPPQSAKTAEELIRKNTGWTIPVTQLAWWVRGLPDPSSKVTGFTPNAQGLIATLEQQGWTLTYGDYLMSTSPQGQLAMPGRIVAEYKDVRLTLVVREWNLGQPAPAQ